MTDCWSAAVIYSPLQFMKANQCAEAYLSSNTITRVFYFSKIQLIKLRVWEKFKLSHQWEKKHRQQTVTIIKLCNRSFVTNQKQQVVQLSNLLTKKTATLRNPRGLIERIPWRDFLWTSSVKHMRQETVSITWVWNTPSKATRHWFSHDMFVDVVCVFPVLHSTERATEPDKCRGCFLYTLM